MAIALLRLVLREGLDDDPLIGELGEKASARRKAASASGRRAARRARSDEAGGAAD